MKKLYYILTIVLLGAIAMPTEAADWSSYKIMIDPGHGGSDSGAAGYGGAPHEATLVLRCGLSLKNQLTNELNAKVKMTRSTNVFIGLSSRRESKGSYNPTLFCSIHLNAYNNTAKGTETLYTNNTTNTKNLANDMQSQLKAELEKMNGTNGYNFTNRGVKTASLAVCRGYTSVPAILTEGLFVDNKSEWNLIKSESSTGYKRWVHGHIMGFYKYLTRKNSSIDVPQFGGGSSSGGNTEEPTTPPATSGKIEYSPSSVALTAEWKGATQPSVDVKVTATGLTENMIINPLHSTAITATTLSGWNDLKGGTIRLTLNTNYGDTLKTEPTEGYVAVQSGSSTTGVRVQIPYVFSFTAPGASTEVPDSDQVKIVSSAPSVTLTGVYQSTTKPYKDIKITGYNLGRDIYCNSSTGFLTTEKLPGWNDRDGGTLRVTFNTSFEPDGYPGVSFENYSDGNFIAVQAGGKKETAEFRIEIPVTVSRLPAGSAEAANPDKTGDITPENPNPGIPDQGGTTNPDQGGTTTPTTPDATYGAVNFFYQGGTPATAPADNEALWALFKPEYNVWYAAHLPAGYTYKVNNVDTPSDTWQNRSEDATMADAASFANAYAKDFLTNSASTWSWLGSYLTTVASPDLTLSAEEVYWRFTMAGFFNCYKKYVKGDTNCHWASYGDFTTAGKPEAWKPAYIFGHKPTKSGATFLGWFDNANGSGSPFTTVPASGNVYACWSGGTITAVENLTSEVRVLPTFTGVELFFEGTTQVVVYNVNGVQVAGGVATERFACDLQSGMYIIRVGNEVFKFIR